LLALVTLGIKTVLEWKQAREFAQAQHAPVPVSESDTTLLAREGSR
jgi:hypothetical protein